MFAIRSEKGDVFTSDLASSVGFELLLTRVERRLEPVAGNLLRAIAQYLVSEDRSLQSGQTIDWASSLLVAREYAPSVFALDEMAFDGETVVVGANTTLDIWGAQSSTCRAYDAALVPCRYGHTVAVSPGVLESDRPIEGIRYPLRPTASGWWLFSPEYNGQLDNFASMKTTHTFHVLQHRRDVARYLGLPVGFAFDDATNKVWRDIDAVPLS